MPKDKAQFIFFRLENDTITIGANMIVSSYSLTESQRSNKFRQELLKNADLFRAKKSFIIYSFIRH